MIVKKTPEDARGGQKLRRDRYLLPGLLIVAFFAFLVTAMIIY